MNEQTMICFFFEGGSIQIMCIIGLKIYKKSGGFVTCMIVFMYCIYICAVGMNVAFIIFVNVVVLFCFALF